MATKVGTDDKDKLKGTANPDGIFGMGGNDKIWGFAGDDFLTGGDGNDKIYGGDDNDVIEGGGGSDKLFGEAGDDTIIGGGGDDIIEGGEGADMMYGGDGNDTLSYASSTDGVSVALHDLGEIEVFFGTYAIGDTGIGFENITGSAFGDALNGNDDANVLKGGGGDDYLAGDPLFGVGGRDLLVGGSGDDFLIGRGGRDVLKGGSGDDVLTPGSGKDVVKGGSGADLASYRDSPAAVTIRLGKNGAETVGKGGDANGDKISKVEGVRGSDHDDKLIGNKLANVLVGEEGNDILKGKGGDDHLSAGDGNDMLIGGGGNDTFDFYEISGQNKIKDFKAGAGTDDVIVLDHIIYNDVNDVKDASQQVGDDVVITHGVDDTLTLKNVQLNDLHADDFSFV
jgi:Ca2+-binding RTX toxin-like protein